MLKAPRPPPILKGRTDKEKIIIKGIPDKFEEGPLIQQVEALAQASVRALIHGRQRGTVLVDFDGIPGKVNSS